MIYAHILNAFTGGIEKCNAQLIFTIFIDHENFILKLYIYGVLNIFLLTYRILSSIIPS